jgi:hypothetical protein
VFHYYLNRVRRNCLSRLWPSAAAAFAEKRLSAVRAAMLEALITRTYKKDLQNLALEERRLRGQLEKHIAELKQLQDDRDGVQFRRRNRLMMDAKRSLCGFKPPADAGEQFCFEFTEEFLETRF